MEILAKNLTNNIILIIYTKSSSRLHLKLYHTFFNLSVNLVPKMRFNIAVLLVLLHKQLLPYYTWFIISNIYYFLKINIFKS